MTQQELACRKTNQKNNQLSNKQFDMLFIIITL